MVGPYQAPDWLRNPHAQTIWPALIKGRMPAMQRQRWDTPDGDFVDVDLLPQRVGMPLVTLFHGLEGSSSSHYARALMREVAARGWNGVVIHFRGCSGEPNRLPRAYHSGDADEIDWMLRRMAVLFPDVPRHAVGVSLGGNALLCWLGTRGAAAADLLHSAAAISAPLDLSAAGHTLARGFNRFYTHHFLRSLRRSAAHKAQAFPGSFDGKRAVLANTLFEFDDAYTGPMHGYLGAEDYWQRASSKPLLPHITLPTLILNARNDPFLPNAFLPTQDEVSPSVLLEQPEEGGHVGFVSGAFPGRLDWLPQRLLAFFSAAAAQANDQT